MKRVLVGLVGLCLVACSNVVYEQVAAAGAPAASPATGAVRAAATAVAPAVRSSRRADRPTHQTLPACPAAGTYEDIYYPAWRGRLVPVIVFLHGGSWVAGGRTDILADGPLLSLLRGRGYAVVSIDYRTAPTGHWPTMLDDSRCALANLRAKAAGLGLDGSRIGVLGWSAGGQLALLLGLELPAAERPALVIDASGVTDLTQPGFVSGQVEMITREVFGATGLAAPVLRQASPVTWVRPGAPPVLVLHGTADLGVPYAQALELVAALQRNGDPVELVPLPGVGHSVLVPAALTKRAQLLAFLQRYLPA